jgi:hypothetical protein
VTITGHCKVQVQVQPLEVPVSVLARLHGANHTGRYFATGVQVLVPVKVFKTTIRTCTLYFVQRNTTLVVLWYRYSYCRCGVLVLEYKSYRLVLNFVLMYCEVQVLRTVQLYTTFIRRSLVYGTSNLYVIIYVNIYFTTERKRRKKTMVELNK